VFELGIKEQKVQKCNGTKYLESSYCSLWLLIVYYNFLNIVFECRLLLQLMGQNASQLRTL
jgi:hypothetical protein